ncbi:MAG TPA: WGR domain-containing protein [Leptolyngbyaceae cyanobacterium]
METYLVYVDAASNSNKFWSAKIEGNQLTVEWGRVGYNPQRKVHNLANPQKAMMKYQSLVAEKQMKGYRESQPQIDDSRDISEIRRAIELLEIIRRCVEQKRFDNSYINSLNQYLKIIPTPLGMQIDPGKIFRSVADVDHQRQLLSSLIPVTPVTATVKVKEATTTDEKVVSLRGIHPNLWRHF